jgi:hypothetical protein
MAKPDAGQNAMQGMQGAMGGANARRRQWGARKSIDSANAMRDQFRAASPDSTGGGNLGDIPAGKFNPMMGRPMMGLGANNYLAALQPPGPTTMPPPPGNNYMSNMLQKTGFNPAEGQIGIRRPMADQLGALRNAAGRASMPGLDDRMNLAQNAAQQRMQAFSPFGRFGG